MLLVLLAACGDPSSQATDEHSPDSTDGSHAVVVTQTYEPGPGGVMLAEGGIGDVLVRDAEGRERGQQADPSKPMTFDDLPAGRYTLAAAIRPCNANCGNLEARTGGCETTIDVPAVSRVSVRYIATKPCQVLVEQVPQSGRDAVRR